MSYSIDRDLSWDGLYKIYTPSGTEYLIKMKESAPDSGLWTINLIRPSEKAPTIEIFRTLKLVSEVCQEYLNEVKANKLLLLIAGDIDESQKKAKVFTRWMESDWNDWDFKIDRPEIRIDALRSANIKSTSFSIILKRKNNLYQSNTQKPTNNVVNHLDIKFCFNCGTPNNNFAFCPSCGTKLKQA